MTEEQSKFWVVYQHGEPHGIRSSEGFLCFFHPVTKFPGQEARYTRELDQRRMFAEFIAKALTERTDRND